MLAVTLGLAITAVAFAVILWWLVRLNDYLSDDNRDERMRREDAAFMRRTKNDIKRRKDLT